MAVGTNMRWIDEDGDVIADGSRLPRTAKVPNLDVIHASLMFRRWLSVARYEEPSMDQAFITEIMRHGDISNLPDYLYYRRLRRGSDSYRLGMGAELGYRYRLCRTLTWGCRFDRAKQEAKKLLRAHLPFKYRLNVALCYLIAKLRIQTLPRGIVQFRRAVGWT
jgi:hypothetical protein